MKRKSAETVLGDTPIEGEMTIYRAAELKSMLRSALDSASPGIDLAGVTEIDSAGIQLLIWAKKAAVANGKDLQLKRHSQAVVEVLELTNLTGYFGDPVLIAPAA